MSEQFPTPGTESSKEEKVFATTAEGIIRERIDEIQTIAEERERTVRSANAEIKTIPPGEDIKQLGRTRDSMHREVVRDLGEVRELVQGLHAFAEGKTPSPKFQELLKGLIEKEAGYLKQEWIKAGRPLADSIRGKNPSKDKVLASTRLEALQDMLGTIQGFTKEIKETKEE